MWIVWAWLAVSAAAFALAGHGNDSHHAPGQIAALAILLPWPLLVAAHWSRFEWTDGSLRWLVAALAWGFVLTVSGFLIFLPGVSERLKFTNALVAHAHLAMAGLLTSINAVLLLNLGRRRVAPHALGSPVLFWLWQAGCVIHVAVLSALGWIEGGDPSVIGAGDWAVDAGYHARLLSGVMMTIAGAGWLWKLTARRRTEAK
jgi:cytochrome c oxidase cbb3-type subunit 1